MSVNTAARRPFRVGYAVDGQLDLLRERVHVASSADALQIASIRLRAQPTWLDATVWNDGRNVGRVTAPSRHDI